MAINFYDLYKDNPPNFAVARMVTAEIGVLREIKIFILQQFRVAKNIAQETLEDLAIDFQILFAQKPFNLQ